MWGSGRGHNPRQGPLPELKRLTEVRGETSRVSVIQRIAVEAFTVNSQASTCCFVCNEVSPPIADRQSL
jgi:hypothetical protein